MAVYSVVPSEVIELSFVFERLYLRRNGTTRITVDVLVRNLGGSPIGCLRVLLPYSLIDIRSPRENDLQKAEAVFEKFRRIQAGKIRIASDELRNPSSDSNWIYRLLAHASIHYGPAGTIALRRLGQERGSEVLDGYVKRAWRVESPRSLNAWGWFLSTVNGLTLVDLVAPRHEPHEDLLPNEKMWFRLEFTLPAAGENEHSLLSRLASPSWEYEQRFTSPAIIIHEARQLISLFEVPAVTMDDHILDNLYKAKKELVMQFPDPERPVEIRDWRIFLYRESGLSVERIAPLGAEPKTPNIRENYYLPLEAYGRGVRFRLAPSWLYRRFRALKRPTSTLAQQFWIGSDHGRADPHGYGIDLKLRFTNDFLVWAGFFFGGAAVLVSIVHFLAHRFHWLGF